MSAAIPMDPTKQLQDGRGRRQSSRTMRTIRSVRRSQAPVIDVDQTTVLPDDIKLEDETTETHAKTPLSDVTLQKLNEQSEKEHEREFSHKIMEEDTSPALTVDAIQQDIVIRTRPTLHIAPHVQPAKRLAITYLNLTNFKSYAGRQEVGPFHATFSSVVGPNGSGKSNVIDSLLFVFGFRASKMRQGKLSALIHHSTNFPDLTFCEVEVIFQEVIDHPGDKHEIVANSELRISRKAFKNNTSKYYINAVESNFTTVTGLLRDKGIDLDHKRFLILQGEVESIAQMKPKAATEHDDGLLEYLEDIIGTSKYKAPIEEAALEVDSLNATCVEKNNRVAHTDKERQGLEHRKDAAVEYLQMANSLSLKQSSLYQIYIAECGDNVTVVSDTLKTMKTDMEMVNAAHQAEQNEIQRLRSEYDEEVCRLSALETAMTESVKRHEKVEKESVKIAEKKKHLETKMKKVDKSASSNNFGLSETLAQLGRLDEDRARLADESVSIQDRMKEDETELSRIRASLNGKTQGLSDTISQKLKNLDPWTAQISHQRSLIAVAQSELTIFEEQWSASRSQVDEAQEKVKETRETHARKRKEAEQLQQQIQEHHMHIAEKKTELAQITKVDPERRSRLTTARQRADEARASLSKSQAQGNVLSSLARLKESGRLHGFHGRLGDLGAIDEKFDVAISTACPALENLVVDTVETGQQCIEHLRKHNLGRANFTILDRLPQKQATHVSTPDNFPRLFDLIRPKHEKFLPAYYSVLQDTLVVPTLEDANRVAYGKARWRVVTLDGQLIDKSGTMSGGGTRVSRGAMSSKIIAEFSKAQIDDLERIRVSVEEEVKSSEQSRQELETVLQKLDEMLPMLEASLQRLLLEIKNLQSIASDAEKRVAELDSESGPDEGELNRVKALQMSIVQSEEKISSLSAESASLNDEIAALQKQLMDIGGVKLRSQQARLDSSKARAEALAEEIATGDLEQAKALKQLAKHEAAQRTLSDEISAMQLAMESVEIELRGQLDKARATKTEVAEAQEVLDKRRHLVQELNSALDQRVNDASNSRGRELEAQNRLDEQEKLLLENQKRLVYWQEKLDRLSIQAAEGYEESGDFAFPVHTPDELADFDKSQLKADIAILEEKTQMVQTDLSVLGEYRRRTDELAMRRADLNEAVDARDAVRKRCEDLRKLRLDGFMEGFNAISLRLKEMYQMITMGGNAELELVDSLDPFSEGILFSVMPPKKSWKNISNLSGGEKTLSSLALVFALHHYKPTPLYVMDEIDAALDFRNVSIVASYIKERTKNAQFIVISLRNNMFELASRLVGVYKVNHMTKSVTVENRDFITRGP